MYIIPFAYTGSVAVAGGVTSGHLKVVRHHTDPGSTDAWQTGEDHFEVDFALHEMDSDRLEGVMSRPDLPEIGLRLRKLADLPG